MLRASYLALASVFVASCALLVASCAPGTPVEFCIEQARAWCDLQFNCCTAMERRNDSSGLLRSASFTRHPPTTAGECFDVAAEQCRAFGAALNESLQEERIEYDVEDATSCIEDLRKAVDSCDPADFFDASGTWLPLMLQTGQPGVLGDGCKKAIQGTVDEGDECNASWECDEGACMVDGTGDDVTVEGECVGQGNADNPLENNVDFEICDGLDEGGT